MFFTVYKITNIITGKIYIGSHKTNNLDDFYLGSGSYLHRSIRKYGVENFKKEILFIFDNKEDMLHKERELVSEDFVKSDRTYNLKIGGEGGWDYLNNNSIFTNPSHSLEHLSKISKLVPLEIKRYGAFKGRSVIDQMIKNNSGVQPWKSNGFKGKTHSSKTRNKMSISAKERLSIPENNSQFGTIWITNGIENKKILKENEIPFGWKRGRTMCSLPNG